MGENKKKDFKLVKDEKPRDINAELESERAEVYAKAERLQAFTQTETFKAL